ncbi:hypothetical protein [Agreia sp. Leaf244]|uniref:hypothetical protein n=1 Tax=Agreia sp. Leaf244 TaxID=1736305 RepID=UPI0012FA2C5B|nr:hypothetical protein [Agreia sp. Leaf244]
MTVAELVTYLQALPQDAVVRLADLPNESRLSAPVSVSSEDGAQVVYLVAEERIGELPSGALVQLRWADEDKGWREV